MWAAHRPYLVVGNTVAAAVTSQRARVQERSSKCSPGGRWRLRRQSAEGRNDGWKQREALKHTWSHQDIELPEDGTRTKPDDLKVKILLLQPPQCVHRAPVPHSEVSKQC